MKRKHERRVLYRGTALFLALLLSLGALPTGAWAAPVEEALTSDAESAPPETSREPMESDGLEETAVTVDPGPYLYQSGATAASNEAATYAASKTAEAQRRILAGLEDQAAEIDISDCQISCSEIGDLFYGLVNTNPRLFYVEQFSYTSVGSGVLKVLPTYHTFYRDIPAAQAKYEAAVSEALACAEGLSDPLDQVIAIHDWMVLHAVYDEAAAEVANTSADDAYTPSYSAYGVLVNGTGVCNSYALAFYDLMTRLGIPAGYGHGPGHIWNMVQLNGSWYHVDVTWDDPVGGSFCAVGRSYFLVSEEKMAATDGGSTHNPGSSQYQADHSATSTTYDSDSYWWRSSVGGIYPQGDGSCVYLKNSGNYTMQLVLRSGSSESVLSEHESATWPVWGGSALWRGIFSGLSHTGDIYFYNDKDTVYSYDLSTGRRTTVYTYSAGDGYIYGCMVEGSQATLGIAQDANDSMNLVTVTLDGVTPTPTPQPSKSVWLSVAPAYSGLRMQLANMHFSSRVLQIYFSREFEPDVEGSLAAIVTGHMRSEANAQITSLDLSGLSESEQAAVRSALRRLVNQWNANTELVIGTEIRNLTGETVLSGTKAMGDTLALFEEYVKEILADRSLIQRLDTIIP